MAPTVVATLSSVTLDTKRRKLFSTDVLLPRTSPKDRIIRKSRKEQISVSKIAPLVIAPKELLDVFVILCRKVSRLRIPELLSRYPPKASANSEKNNDH